MKDKKIALLQQKWSTTADEFAAEKKKNETLGQDRVDLIRKLRETRKRCGYLEDVLAKIHETHSFGRKGKETTEVQDLGCAESNWRSISRENEEDSPIHENSALEFQDTPKTSLTDPSRLPGSDAPLWLRE